MAGAAWTTWLAIAAGSAAGGVLRQAATEAVSRWTGGGFPWGTLSVNLLGSLGIGVCVALSSAAGAGGWSPAMRHATMTGLLGGFTTFSTFSVQTMTLLQEGHWMAAAANAVSSVVLGVMACAAGYSAVVALAR